MRGWQRQAGYDVRLEWGLAGARALASDVDVAVVVDVLSFTTTLSVAVDRSTEVAPFPWRDDRAAAEAERQGTVLARGRRKEGLTLSPASLRANPAPARLLLPSPNGSMIAHHLGGHVPVVAASLRNAAAVARWLEGRGTVGVVAAGEGWPGGELRPAVEDLWGAGAVIARLAETRCSSAVAGGSATQFGVGRMLSPEAAAATAGWRAVSDDIGTALRGCASGRELASGGFAEDVEIAAEQDASDLVPLLVDGVFVRAC